MDGDLVLAHAEGKGGMGRQPCRPARRGIASPAMSAIGNGKTGEGATFGTHGCVRLPHHKCRQSSDERSRRNGEEGKAGEIGGEIGNCHRNS